MRLSMLVVALAVAGCGPTEGESLGQSAQGLTQVTGFGTNPGNFSAIPPPLRRRSPRGFPPRIDLHYPRPANTPQ